MSVPLLTTKLYIPPRRPGLVLRPRLLERLDEALHLRQKLTLVSAKAGAGKTTLVSEWLHQQQRSPAWLSLDANDSEPQRFARYLVAALNEVDITLDRNLAGQWQTP
ncbi:MAG: LuxR family transcriptional regulator, partial [Anaerolineae bacterium]